MNLTLHQLQEEIDKSSKIKVKKWTYINETCILSGCEFRIERSSGERIVVPHRHQGYYTIFDVPIEVTDGDSFTFSYTVL